MKMKTENTAYECALMLQIETPHYEFIKRKGETPFAIFSPREEEDAQYLLKIKSDDGLEVVIPATFEDLETDSTYKSVEKVFVSKDPPRRVEPEERNDHFNECLTQVIDGTECPTECETHEQNNPDDEQPGCSKDLVEERIKCHHYRVAIAAKISQVEHNGHFAFVFENPPGVYDKLKLIPGDKFQRILVQNQKKVPCLKLGAKNLHTPENPIVLPEKMNKPKRKYTRRNYKKDNRDDKDEEETPKGRGRGRPPKAPSKRSQENVLRDEDFNDEARKRKAEIEETVLKIKEEKPDEPDHSDVDAETLPKPKKRRGRPPKPQLNYSDEIQEDELIEEDSLVIKNFP